METRKVLGIVALALTSACGLDEAGAVSADAGVGGALIDGRASDASATDARHDVFHSSDATVTDAPKESGQVSNEAAADVGADSWRGDGGDATGSSHEDAHVDSGSPHDAGSAHDGAAGDAGPYDAGGHDGASGDAGGHDASLPHDAADHDAADAAPVTQPPDICIISYSCGSATCNCNQTCATSECGACVDHYTTCNNILGTCGTDLSAVYDCGSCGNSCPACSLGDYRTCNLSGSTYVCGCASL